MLYFEVCMLLMHVRGDDDPGDIFLIEFVFLSKYVVGTCFFFVMSLW